MKAYTYKKIDAFASGGSTGNPAACLYLAPGETLSPDEMLAVAQQHKGFVSEVAYCETSALADVKLTYYSSECEVDFCGHATIACLYELAATDPRFIQKAVITVQTNKMGLLTVTNRVSELGAVFITAPDAAYTGTALTGAEAADALGLPESSLSSQLPIDVINAGLTTLIIPVLRLTDMVSMLPDETRLKAFCEAQGVDIVLAFCMETAQMGYHAHTRVFAPRFGYLEDPATGSGNSAFGYYMLRTGLWDGSGIRIEQGGEDRIFNTVQLTAPNGRVQFGGSATVRISGEYYI